MSIHKKWIIQTCNDNLVRHISNKFNVSPIIAKILINRDITCDEEINDFLYVNNNQFLDPYLLTNMKNAVDCINCAISTNKRIAVYGDYDVDGITSTYILYDYLISKGADVIFYIPDRADEGYGLNVKAIDYLADCGINLIITVDVGITAVGEVAYANKKGIEIVITDHHTPIDIIPDASAVINPKLQGDIYPNRNLAGVGVAFKLIYALSDCDKEIIEKYCEFACIGTIADMVPLTGENRFIASYGLKKISHTDNFGLRAIVEASGIDITSITSSNISFAIAPRLNAAGRIGSAKTSVKLFISKSKEEASKLAETLDNGNKERQNIEQQILDEAIEIIENNNLHNDKVIVVAKSGWHHGIIGIVSSKITEKYYKPSTVISINEDGSSKASGRSINGFNLFDALSSCADVLDKFGGHELAAGFSLQEKNIDEFRRKINLYANNIITDDVLTPTLAIDAELNAEDVTLKTAYDLKILEPHGIGNRTPLLCLNNVNISNVKIHKSGKHAFVAFEKSNHRFDSPAFNMADGISEFSNGDAANIAGTMNVNNYRGIENVQFIIRDISLLPASSFSIENLRCVYVALRDYINRGRFVFSLADLSSYLKKHFGCKLGYIRLQKAIESLTELTIIKSSFNSDVVTVSKGEKFYSKCDPATSPTFQAFNSL